MSWWAMFWKWRRERSPERKKRDVWTIVLPAGFAGIGGAPVVNAWNEHGPLGAFLVLVIVVLVFTPIVLPMVVGISWWLQRRNPL